jgi:hypothetical protein
MEVSAAEATSDDAAAGMTITGDNFAKANPLRCARVCLLLVCVCVRVRGARDDDAKESRFASVMC